MDLQFSRVFILTVALAWAPVMAQESVDELEPAVDTTPMPGIDEMEPAVDAAAMEDPVADIDDLEPGVPTQVLMTDNRRRGVPGGGVMDELDLGATEITGNQELPTVLYIVPWKKSDPGDLMGRPANTLLDEVLAPVDRGEFTRQVDYYDDLFETEQDQ